MVEGRGRKQRKKGWQISLGVREILLTSLGIIGLMVMSFGLGTLAGRGEIYRVLQHWGLIKSELPKTLQPWEGPAGALPAPGVLPAPPPAQLVNEPSPAAPNPEGVQAKAAAPGGVPVKGAIAALPDSAGAKKKGKASLGPRDKKWREKAKEEELQKLRAEIASKLKFQNSLGSTTPKTSAGTAKTKPKVSVTQIKVAQFRDPRAARAKLAEMQKRGEKVSLRQGTDAEGPFFAIYRKVPAAAPAAKKGEKTPRPAESRE